MNTPARNALDDKVNQVFAGKCVRKDLVRAVKVGANVPVFVLEYLLGKYCASSDPAAIELGLAVVRDTLANNYIRPDEANKAQSRVRQKGSYTFIDKVKARLIGSTFVAECVNFGSSNLRINENDVYAFERLLTGGVWAQVEVEWDESDSKAPFSISQITPIQLASFNLEEYRKLRTQFSTDEWIDLLIRSMGYEPSSMEQRLKLLFLLRLIPLCERNYNLVELGPRGTGKSFAVQELSPYAALLTGPTTVANLFGHMSGKIKGMVSIWDVVAFDEIADLQKMPKEVITTMKTFCESGQFQRGAESFSGDASIAMFGNTQQPIDVMVQTGHLFAPMPDVIRDDMAFIDRLHCYLPGWEMPTMRNEYFTDNYGFVIDYLAEALKDLRKLNYTELCDTYFSLGAHLNTRDRKAVRRTVSGLVKIIHPHGSPSKEDLEEILKLAIEGRRRVKEQLKKMGSFQYSQTSFSYSDNSTGEEHFVGVPEQGGKDLIASEPLSPGSIYAASVTGDGNVGLYRLEVSISSGNGKLKPAGGIGGTMKESIQRAFAYMQANKGSFSITHETDNYDFNVEAIDLLGNKLQLEIGVAFFIAAFSAIRHASARAGMLVIGDMSIQGNIKAAKSLVELLQVAMDNGARCALIPAENKRSFLEVDTDVIDKIDPIFYNDVKTATFKGLEVI
ncbi:protease Lon-related BREX system protein BrxL [Synechococcus lacustris]|uniref:BREX system Lon protease-like protein BrxL n=1 Tax=Synechococcus lacustris str. Tous TaxID=1910958 RepID=A0A2P7ECD4_9SYNE|nr:protease Lon-related BREX system protein BrxL [Synechococcus lacustris]PSI00873.1 BREX system Lon protease-like protein BrxL [Synechococcus lacustris str. Tous]